MEAIDQSTVELKEKTPLHKLLISRKFLNRLMIVAAVIGLILSPIFGWITLADIKYAFSLSIKKLIEDMHFLLPALVGVLILWNESRLKRALHERELVLNKMKFDAERHDREERLKFLTDEADSLRGVSTKLAKSITEQLATDTRWASEALERAKLGSHSKTLFGERVGHFYDEKEQLAEQFLPRLLQRCHALVESGKRVFLLIDSGTTLYPFFRELGQAAVRYRENNESWIDEVEVVTNNLPGVESLMDFGRRNPNNRYSPLAIKCQLLPGAPLPVYSAVTGDIAVNALHRLKEQPRQKESVFIGLVTGNWIRLRIEELACPVPLARGEGHLEFKEALIDCSTEVYVVAPLGKIFVKVSLAELNQALGYKDANIDPDKKPYKELTIDIEKAKHVKLISTSRELGRVLYPLSLKLQVELHYDDADYRKFMIAEAPSPQHVLFPFNQLPENWYEEITTEFPHRPTRRPEIREAYFFVPPHPPERKRNIDEI